MAASEPPLAETLLRQAAEHSLRVFLEPNSIFLAERLHLMYPSDVSANLLATAHLRQGNFSQAAEILRPASTPDNRYLYAVCLSRIGTPEALRDAEAHLRGVHGPIDVVNPSASAASTPGGAAGLYLLGTICLRTGRRDEAIPLFQRAVKANPTLWVAFESLANMGIVTKAEQTLGSLNDAAALERLEAQPQFLQYTSEIPTPRRRNRTATTGPREGRPVSAPASRNHGAQPNGGQGASGFAQQFRTPVGSTEVHSASFATPSPMPNRVGGIPFGEMTTPSISQAPAGRHVAGRRLLRNGASPLNTNSRQSNRRSVTGLDSHVRNPNDLFATPSSESQPLSIQDSTPGIHGTQPSGQGVDPKAPVSGTSAAPISFQKARLSLKTRVTPAQLTRDDDGSEAMDSIRQLGQVVSEMGRFRCTKTLELTESLPRRHRYSGLVLSIRGRAFLEKGDYAAAEHEFLKSLSREPTRMDGVVEYYSTVLWHLKKDKELAQLAVRAQRVFPVSSSAWCVAGNCFSLQKDPDTALRFFRKAIAASKVPTAYAHTLSGHEHAAKENFEAALAAYRQALHIDERHYNAMYGIGQVLQKQEKYSMASSHFRSAVVVHPLNPTLHYHLGMALAASVHGNQSNEHIRRGDRDAYIPALAEFETAANLDPKNPLPRFEKAKILVAMCRFSDAKRQLESLRDTLPKEAEVHFELSKVCRRMGDIKGALKALSVALDIEPKERKFKKMLEALSNELDTPRSLQS